MNYDELIADLRYCADTETSCSECKRIGTVTCEVNLHSEAADAIEELQQHYCRHAIHNVHDRGDDSLCRVLKTEPPKEETE